MNSIYSFTGCREMGLATFFAPFQGAVKIADLIQGLRAKPLAPGYLMPRLRRWLSRSAVPALNFIGRASALIRCILDTVLIKT